MDTKERRTGFSDEVRRPARRPYRTRSGIRHTATEPGHCRPTEPYRMTWTLSGDRLTFSDYRSNGFVDDQYNEAKDKA